MSLLARIRSIVSVNSLVAILLLALVFRVVAYFNVRIEDLQFLFFPLILIALARLATLKEHRIPKSLLVFAAALWLLASAHVEGYLPKHSEAAVTRIARLHEDTSGMQARSLFLRINQIARTYNLPVSEMMRKSLKDETSARNWIETNAECSLLIRGEPKWLSVVLCESISAYLGPLLKVMSAERSPSQQALAKQWQLKSGKDVLFVTLPGTSAPFAVLYQPMSVAVPGNPEELGRHWLAWFATAFSQEKTQIRSNEEIAQFFSRRLDALNEASLIDGPWKSNLPRATSDYLSGTLSLLQALHTKAFGSEEALRHLRRAAGRVDRQAGAEHFTSVFNNAAIALLVKAKTQEEIAKAREWLLTATTAESQPLNSTPMRAAFYNLSLMDTAELSH